MPKNFLPPLKPNNHLDLPTTVGAWRDGQARTQLHRLANAIAVQPGATNIHSIPDPWARVLLFGRALFDPGHQLHKKTLGEWRGALAILGLKEIRNFNELDVLPISLRPQQQVSGSFAHTVSRVLPGSSSAISDSANWEDFHLLRWHGARTGRTPRAFAMTSPATLVATGVDYSEVLSEREVPWFVKGVLVDPTEGHLHERNEKPALAQWILQLRAAIGPLEPSNAERHGRILEYLEDYANELAPQEHLRPSEEVLSDIRLGLDGAPLYNAMNQPHKSASRIVTDVLIVTDRPDAPPFVLVDPSLARQMNLAERDITVYRDINLFTADRHLPDLRARKTGVFPHLDAAPIHWCTADFFFQSDLIYEQLGAGGADADESFPGCLRVTTQGQAAGRNAAFPLTEEAVKLFTPAYLARNFTLEWLRSGDKDSPIARATLRLQIRRLEGATPAAGRQPAAAPQWITIEHLYMEADKCRVTNLPAIAIWPNFRFADEPAEDHNGRMEPAAPRNRWTRYYLFESWRGQLGSDNFKVTPLMDQLPESKPVQSDNEWFQVTVMPRFPDVLMCRMPFNDDKPRLNDARPPTGMLLLRVPEPTQTRNAQGAALGIDFGTTGTSIYRALGIGEGGDNDREDVALLTFANRTFQVTGYDEKALPRLTRELFIPGHARSSGNVLSIFEDFSGRSGDRITVRDGHVLFVPDYPGNFVRLFDGVSIKSDLKWGADRQNSAARDFLTQLCIQSVAELVVAGATSVEIRYSYPTAFSDSDFEWFNGIWRMVIRQVESVTCLKVSEPDLEDGQDLGVDNCEAVAATRFFAHPINPAQFNVTRGAITLDIGGGTTDIAIWNKDTETNEPKLLAHLSVLFAGRDIFLTAIREKPELLTIIDNDTRFTQGAYDTLKSVKELSPQAYNAEIDATIQRFGTRLMERLPDVSRTPEIQEFLSILELGICGVAFYAGLLVGQLIEEGKYEFKDSKSRIPVFVGGNGSKILQWCALGQLRPESIIIKKFSQCLLAGAKVAAGDKVAGRTVDVNASPRPKEEVAFGLVVRGVPVAKETGIEPPSGESFWVGPGSSRKQEDWRSALDTDVLITNPVQVDSGLPIFHKFAEAQGLKLSDREWYDIADAVDRELHKTRDLAKRVEAQSANGKVSNNSMRKQPMFIMALKYLVAQRVKNLAPHA
jgi:hypothetical protein